MPTWHTGQAWRVVNSLNRLNEQIRAYAPRAVPPATDVDSWGSIADSAHSTSSDHYPHYFEVLGATAVVCARDFPHAPGLGLDGGVVTEHMRQMRDARVQYIIFNRRITGVNYGWQWHTYTGDDPHNTHFHVSSVHEARADNAGAWSLPGAAISTTSYGGTEMFVQTPDGAVWAPENGKLHHVTLTEWNRFTGDNPRPSVLILDSAAALDDFKAAATVVPNIDVSEVVGALVHAPDFGTLIHDQAYQAAQDAEKS